jgi:hypothetical protein
MTGPDDYRDEMNTPTPRSNDDNPGTEPELDALFADLHGAAYAGTPVEPAAELHQFVSIGRTDISDTASTGAAHDLGELNVGAGPSPETSRRTPMLTTFTALFASATGKLVLTGSLAAASVAGAHTAGVVDVPLLPDVDDDAVVLVQDDDTTAVAAAPAQTSTTTTTVEPAAETTTTIVDLDTAGRVTLTINGEQIELTNGELNEFFDDIEANVDANTEQWTTASETCETAFDGIDEDAVDGTNIDALLESIDAALDTCFTALDAAGLTGPLAGIDLSEIDDIDIELDGLTGFPFDLDDLFDDHHVDGHHLDLDDFDIEDLDLDTLPFDPTDPEGLRNWLQEQGFDDLEGLSDLEGLGLSDLNKDWDDWLDELEDRFDDDDSDHDDYEDEDEEDEEDD